MNARGLALAGVALGVGLLVFAALSLLGGGDARPRALDPVERSARGADPPGLIDSLSGELLRPGPLSPAHAHLEGAQRCTLCHGRAAAVPDVRCQACHPEIALRAQRRLPLHGGFAGACASCHAEHDGGETRVIDLEHDAFAHGTTRFALAGAHARLECEDCHRLHDPGADGEAAFHYQGVPFSSCAACHRDPHAGGVRAGETVGPLVRVALDDAAPPAPARDPAHPLAGRDCAQCHGEASFRSAGLYPDGFSHAADTRFELHGAHSGVACAACHTAERRELEQREGIAPGSAAEPHCGSCHRDPHRGALGSEQRCASCHTPRSWSEGFDHALDTRFALDELHAELRCESCHADARYRAAGRACEDCHGDAAGLLAGRFGAQRGEPDPHQGALECADCHAPAAAGNRPAALAARCASCHDPSYSALLSTWRARLDEAAVAAHGDAQLIERLRRSGPHGFSLALELLRREAPGDR
jgi:hypothetical protein